MSIASSVAAATAGKARETDRPPCPECGYRGDAPSQDPNGRKAKAKKARTQAGKKARKKPVRRDKTPCLPFVAAGVEIVTDFDQKSNKGIPTTPYATPVPYLDVSNKVTTEDLPAGFLDPSDDWDNFKLQVHDFGVTGDTIPAENVLVQMFKPGNAPKFFWPPRKLSVELRRVPGTVYFRSRYLRLVVDEADKKAKPDQTVLADWDPNDPKAEILGQVMRVSYKASDGCHRFAQAKEVGGPMRSYFKVRLHILRQGVGAAGVVKIADATRRVHKWLRRVLAQVNLAPKLLLPARLIDPVENVIEISGRASGREMFSNEPTVVKFRITSIQTTPPYLHIAQDVGPLKLKAGTPPSITADKLASLITVKGPFKARPVVNPPSRRTFGGYDEMSRQVTTDLIISDPQGGWIKIEPTISQGKGPMTICTDPTQHFKVCKVFPTDFDLDPWWKGNENLGSLMERALVHNYGSGDNITGKDCLDIFVVTAKHKGLYGSAFLPFRDLPAAREAGKPPLSRQALPRMKWSVFVDSAAMDGTENYPFVLGHECGHALLDAGHLDGPYKTELMCDGGEFADKAVRSNRVGAPKRISEESLPFNYPRTPPSIDFDAGDHTEFEQEQRIRESSSKLLLPFKD